MSRAIISQREAHRLRRRVAALEKQQADQSRRWASEWPNGVNIYIALSVPEPFYAVVDTARRLGHAVVCTTKDGQVFYYGIRL